jgi:hypothetical protein
MKSTIPRPSKMYQRRHCCYENIPPGNPGPIWSPCSDNIRRVQSTQTKTINLRRRTNVGSPFMHKKETLFACVCVCVCAIHSWMISPEINRKNACSTWIGRHQGCQIFLVQNTKTGKNIPNYHELYQMSIKYNKKTVKRTKRP